MSKLNIDVTVNGRRIVKEVSASRMLSEFLRDDLHLTGTKRGCETGTCGACTVIKDGKAVKSCLGLVAQAQNSEITTIEGMSDGDTLHPLQDAFMQNGGLQCGYCTPGMIMTAAAMLRDNPKATSDEVRTGLSGNLCRCTGYTGIVDSILSAAEKLNGS